MGRKIIDVNTNVTPFVTNKNKDGIDPRGSRPKFWFTFNDDEEKSKWMFKNKNRDANGKIQTYEDIGEIIFQYICEQVDMPCAVYELAQKEQDGEMIDGVISKSYLPEKPYEISGYALLDMSKNFDYDNLFGQKSTFENTIKNYIYGLKVYHYANPKVKIDTNKITLQIEKMFILDYLCAQADRNWYNLSFILDKSNHEFVMAPLFDNGNIFCWNHKESVIEHQNTALTNKYKYNVLAELLSSKPIAMGISTPTALRDPKNPLRTLKSNQNAETMQYVEKELVEMICSSPKLLEFVQNNFQEDNQIIDTAFAKFNETYNESYPTLQSQSKKIFALRSKHLIELVNEKLKQMSTEEENEDEYNI